MADITAFRGIRPHPDLVAEIAALPYDVVSRRDVIATMERHPRTFLRVTRADAELDPSVERVDPRVFAASRGNLQTMLDEGWLVQDAGPCLYIYEQKMGDHRQVGLVAAASLADYANGVIKRHEKTRERELEDRTRHIEAVGANTGPAFLTYRARPAIDAIVAEQQRATPIYDFVADDGIGHRLWVVADARVIEELERELEQVPALYIADGHHRTAASAKVRDRCRQRHPGSSDCPCEHFLAVIFPHDQLQILSYNRVVADLNGRSPESFLEAVERVFEVQPSERAVPDQSKTFGMYVAGQWYRLRARSESYAGADPQRALDVSILQEQLLEPVLGIGDPRTDPRLTFIGGIRGVGELERVANASGGVAFYLCPVTIEEVMSIADAGEVMPPKSTWFEPKLRSGMIVRALDPTLRGRSA